MRILAFTHAGPHRARNEDALFVAGSVFAGLSTPVPCVLETPDNPRAGTVLAVIDGMGGQAGGAIAARLLAQALLESSSENHTATSTETIRETISQTLDRAAQVMREAAAQDARLAHMGAALAGVVLNADALVVFNCGDCRVYRQQGRYLDKLSHDHSLVQELCDQGELDDEGMRCHACKHVLTSCVTAGSDKKRQVFFRLLPGKAAQRLLLCSDGVWEALALEELEDCLADRTMAAGAAELARRLLTPAPHRHRDNLSFVLVETGGLEQCI